MFGIFEDIAHNYEFGYGESRWNNYCLKSFAILKFKKDNPAFF